MNRIQKYLATVALAATVVSLSSCTSPADKPQVEAALDTPNQPAPAVTTPAVIPPSKTAGNIAASIAADKNTVTVTIYKPDNQCQDLVAEKVAVPSARTVEAAVGKVLEDRSNSDFNLAGYRVSVNSQTGVATVDMRVAGNSRRQFVSLSSCEQFSLFGSLRKTLTSNTQWKIKDVRFTEQGEEIYL